MKRLDAIRDNALATAMMSRAVYYSMVKLREDSDLTPVRLVEHWAEQQPNNLAITGPEGTLTYRALNRRANAVARVLQRRGAGRGQRLALVMDSRPEFLIAMLGAAKLGMCTALIPARLKADALAHALRVARPDWLILGGECHDDLVLSESSLRISPRQVCPR